MKLKQFLCHLTRNGGDFQPGHTRLVKKQTRAGRRGFTMAIYMVVCLFLAGSSAVMDGISAGSAGSYVRDGRVVRIEVRGRFGARGGNDAAVGMCARTNTVLNTSPRHAG